jgi:hypothetical protein
MKKSNMYDDVKTWNPYRGCLFDCLYCQPSFQRQAKRQKHRCMQCYTFEPHTHPERLDKIPSAKTIFVAGNGDISHCDPEFTRHILASIDAKRRDYQEFYLQSKRPEYFNAFLPLPEYYIMVATLETNRDAGYETISKAPPPTQRHQQFKALNHGRKILTIEPIMAFDLEPFLEMIRVVEPEVIWIGLNSRPRAVSLPEPTPEEFDALLAGITQMGIPFKRKTAFDKRA